MFLRLRIVSTLLLMLGLAAATPPAARVGQLTLHRCAHAQAYCGSIARPLDPTGNVSGTTPIGFTWLPRRNANQPSAGTILAMEGGPGYPSGGSLSAYARLFAPLLRDRDLLLVDDRGTGRSGALLCPQLQSAPVTTLANVGRCGRSLAGRADLYGSAIASDDVAAVLDALGIGKATLYGDSYGTFMVQTFAWRHPDRVRALVLDGAYPVAREDPWLSSVAPQIRRAFDLVCTRWSACAALPNRSLTRIEALLAALRRPGAPVTPSELAFLMDSAGLNPLAYRELDAAARAYLGGDPVPLQRLVREAYHYEEQSGSGVADFSAALFAASSCSDVPMPYDLTLSPPQRRLQWESELRAKERSDPDLYAPFTIREFLGMPPDYGYLNLCLDWPVPSAAHPAAADSAGVHLPNVPVLVLVGDLDTITTPEESAAAAALFARSHLVVVQNTGHVTAVGDVYDCASEIVRRFVATETTGDTSCAQRIPPMPLVDAFETQTSAQFTERDAALAAARDALARVRGYGIRRGSGLRGGTFSAESAGGVTTIRLDAVEWTRDLPVSGVMRFEDASGDVGLDAHLPSGVLVRAQWNVYRPSAPEGRLVDDILPTGQSITPLAAPGAHLTRLATGLRADGNADASGPVSLALSPDGTTLLALTCGYNYQYFYPDGREIRFTLPDPMTGAASKKTADLTQWIFVYRFGAAGAPQVVQRIAIPDAFVGLAWAPDSRRFYVSGGIDDRVAVFARRGASFALDPPEITLGHDSDAAAPLPNYDGGVNGQTIAGRNARGLDIQFGALAAGLSLSGDGRLLGIANMQNDSLSLVDTRTRKVVREVRLHRAGSLAAHGEYPYGAAIRNSGTGGAAETIYVSSLRDGEVDAVRLTGDGAVDRIELGGEPNALLLSRDGSMLYAANGDLDEVDAIDTATNVLVHRISVDRPGQRYRGANPNGLALDESARRLYVTLGGENAVAIVDLNAGRVAGRIPTGWYPTAVATFDGRLAIADAKGLAGPNPGLGAYATYAPSRRPSPTHRDEYVLALEKANLLTMPVPQDAELPDLSRIVDRNNGFAASPPPSPTMTALRGKIRHVIYIMKENRSYDEVLGDVTGANGDPGLVLFPYAIAPNHHRLATEFVTLDNFYTSGDVSADGWNWSQQGRANEYTTRTTPISYASNGFSSDFNGQNRGVNTANPAMGGHDQFDARVTTLLDPSGSSTILPGNKDIAATAGDSDDTPNATGGYIWDSVLRAGESIRHYGMYTDPTYYKIGAPLFIRIVRNAYAQGVRQAPPVRPSLRGRTDLYYRGWDLDTPDRYRYEEWKREFDGYVRNGNLPAFESVCLMMDHFGLFKNNVAGLDTPYLQMADNDYALGLLVEAVAHSRYWKDTAIFVLEDDSQDGPDHVDPHRSIAYVISAYTRRHAVVHARYNTVTMLKTIEELLGVKPLGIFDANAPDMGDVFSTTADTRDRYTAVLPGNLCGPPVHRDLIPECASSSRSRTAILRPRRAGAWWIAKTAGMNFDRPDAVDPLRFNTLLQTGLR
jgi:pimeloyl-ACP methyl ester carboxylesterase/DNA-binding beta-propeller fold protein YncE